MADGAVVAGAVVVKVSVVVYVELLASSIGESTGQLSNRAKYSAIVLLSEVQTESCENGERRV